MTQEQAWAEERHKSEVRMLLRRWRNQGRDAVAEYLDDPRVAMRRAALVADLNEQRRRGNGRGVSVWL